MKWLDKFVEKCIKPVDQKAKCVGTSFEERYNRLKKLVDSQLKEMYQRAEEKYSRYGK